MTRTRTTALLEQELADWARKNQELRQEVERLKAENAHLKYQLSFPQGVGAFCDAEAEERGARSAFEMMAILAEEGWMPAEGDTPEGDMAKYLEVTMAEWKRRRKDGK